MSIELVIDTAFDDEIEKIGGRKKRKGSTLRRAKSSYRKRRKSLFQLLTKYPVLEAIGSAALTTKGLHLLASGGMFGKRVKAFSTGPRAGSIGALGMGVGTTYLGAKGLANILNRLRGD